MKIIKGDLIMTEDMTFDESLKVEGNIYGKDGCRYDLKVQGNLDCLNLDCLNLDCLNLDCLNLDCLNIYCANLDCLNLDCYELSFYAIAIAYNSFKCKSWEARRKNHIIKCLDGEIEIKKNVCEKCGQELKE